MTNQSFFVRNGLTVNSTALVVNATANTVAINKTNATVTLDILGTDAIQLTVGNTAQRPSVVAGRIRYNSDTQYIEYANSSAYGPIAAAVGTQTLSISSGVINWNVSGGAIANVVLSSNSANIAAPTSLVPGSYVLELIQDGTGGRVINNWATIFKFPQGVKPTLTATAHAVDLVSFVYDGTNLMGSYLTNMS